MSDQLDALLTVSRKVIDKHSPALPEKLYHHTTTEGLLKIIPTNTLWATDVRYYNDRLEIEYALSAIGHIFNNIASTNTSDQPTRLIFDAIGPITFVRHDVVMRKCHFYAACFSQEGDDLYQWRTYAKSMDGYAIAFRLDDTERLDICNIIYDETEQTEMINELIHGWLNTIRKVLRDADFANDLIKAEVYKLLRSIVFRTALQFKDPRFAAEREWRIIIDRTGRDIEYRNGRLGLTPYVSLNFCLDNSFRMPVTGVVQGPRVQPKLEMEALAGFLKCHGYGEVERKMSEVPIRF